MKKPLLFSLLFVFGVITFSPANIFAQEKPLDFGIGVMIGEPSGVSIKKWLNYRAAVGFGAAWSLSQNESLHLHSNLLFHDSFMKNPKLYFYHGVGARIIFANTPKVGVRAPLGFTYIFDNIPFDLFVEAVPILNVVPDVSLSGNGGFGFRYYFK